MRVAANEMAVNGMTVTCCTPPLRWQTKILTCLGQQHVIHMTVHTACGRWALEILVSIASCGSGDCCVRQPAVAAVTVVCLPNGIGTAGLGFIRQFWSELKFTDVSLQTSGHCQYRNSDMKNRVVE